MHWLLFDAYKIDYGYEIEIFQNGMIYTNENNTLELSGANFLAKRRMNLKGIHIPCGLVVIIYFLFVLKIVHFRLNENLLFSSSFYLIESKIAYPEKFTYVDDPMTSTIDTFTKAYVKLGENLREDLNMR